MTFGRASLVSLSLVATLAAGCGGGGGGGGDKNPVFVSDPVTRARVDIAYTSQLLAVDPQGKSVEYEVVSAPTGVTIDEETGLVSWTPSSTQVGSQVIHVRATDPSNDEGELLWNVSVGLNLPPTIYPILVSGACVGETVTGRVLASDPDGDPLTFALASPVDGFALAADGSYTYTPEPEGVLPVSIIASDPHGGETLLEQDVVVAGLNGDVFGPTANNLLTGADYVEQFDPTIAAGPDGTIWTAWLQYDVTTDYDQLVLSRFSSTGCLAASNALISTAGNDVDRPYLRVAPDNNAFIVWSEYDDGDGEQTVRAQRFDATGAAQWGAGGVRVSTTAAVNESIPGFEFTANGILVSWVNFGNNELRAQRLNLAGQKQWGADGVLVHAETSSDDLGRNIATDGAGGLAIFWVSSNSDLVYGQRLAAANGAEMWTAGGEVVASGFAGLEQSLIATVRSGTEYFVVFGDGGSGWRGQKVDANGAEQWGASGMQWGGPMDEAYDDRQFLATAGGDLYMTWSQCCMQIPLRKIDGATGNEEWTEYNYLGCCPSSYDASILADGDEIILTYNGWEGVASDSYVVVANRFNSDGARMWGPYGVFVSGGPNQFGASFDRQNMSAAILPSTNVVPGEERVVFTWEDTRNGAPDIFLQHLDADGGPGVAVPEDDD